MQIVQQMWTRFHGIVENVLDAMETGLDYVSFQETLREQLGRTGAGVFPSPALRGKITFNYLHLVGIAVAVAKTMGVWLLIWILAAAFLASAYTTEVWPGESALASRVSDC